MTNEIQRDALLPADMAAKSESIGIGKINLNWLSMFMLSVVTIFVSQLEKHSPQWLVWLLLCALSGSKNL